MLFWSKEKFFIQDPPKAKHVCHLNEDGQHPLMNIVWRKKVVDNIFNHVHRIIFF
jgi:hypothetical protein